MKEDTKVGNKEINVNPKEKKKTSEIFLFAAWIFHHAEQTEKEQKKSSFFSRSWWMLISFLFSLHAHFYTSCLVLARLPIAVFNLVEQLIIWKNARRDEGA
jgi:hypothetical protein